MLCETSSPDEVGDLGIPTRTIMHSLCRTYPLLLLLDARPWLPAHPPPLVLAALISSYKACVAFLTASPALARGGEWARLGPSGSSASARSTRVEMVAAEAATGQKQLETLKFLTPEVCGFFFFFLVPLFPFLRSGQGCRYKRSLCLTVYVTLHVEDALTRPPTLEPRLSSLRPGPCLAPTPSSLMGVKDKSID